MRPNLGDSLPVSVKIYGTGEVRLCPARVLASDHRSGNLLVEVDYGEANFFPGTRYSLRVYPASLLDSTEPPDSSMLIVSRPPRVPVKMLWQMIEHNLDWHLQPPVAQELKLRKRVNKPRRNLLKS